MQVLWRYTCLYICERCYESGGRLWDQVFSHMVWTLFIFELFTGKWHQEPTPRAITPEFRLVYLVLDWGPFLAEESHQGRACRIGVLITSRG